MKLKLSEFSSSELHSMLQDIDALLAKQHRIHALCEKVLQECSELGIDASVIAKALSSSKQKKSTAKLSPYPALFQNSDGKTWSGSGRMPFWLVEVRDAKQSLAPYYIGPDESKSDVLARYKD